MTLGSLLNPLGSAVYKTPLVHERGDYYYPPQWKGYSHNYDNKGYKTAFSALTLLAFLFFLHVLQSCLKDHLNNQTPLVIMMTTTTTTTTTGRKKRHDDLLPVHILSESNRDADPIKNSTALVPYYDFLVDISDGSPLIPDQNYTEILAKVKNELPSLFERKNEKTCTRDCRDTTNNSSDRFDPYKHLNDFWLEEETELSCCKYLMCELQQFLRGNPYDSYISRSVGWLCGLRKYYEIGLVGCQGAKNQCEPEGGSENLSNVMRKTFSNLLAIQPPSEKN